MRRGTYVVEDEPALTERLDRYLHEVAERLAKSPAAADTMALVLSGGYGRGEGGVFRGEDGQAQLYNDLEFYLFTKSGAVAAEVQEWVHQEEQDGTALLGIDVEFKCLGIGALRHGEPSMFYYDLLQGNQLIWGDPDWAKGLPEVLVDAEAIPLHEATRLMFNRGSGLFFSRCALALGDDRVTSGFVQRNHAKARLALGDAVLAANGRYHYFCRERGKRVAAGLNQVPPDWERLQRWHAEGVAFKLQPQHTLAEMGALQETQAQLAEAWGETFRWLEGLRLSTTFPDAASYANYRGRLFPEIPQLRNALLRVRDLKSRGGALGRWMDYPRGELQRILVQLVDSSGDPDLAKLQRRLGGKGSDWPTTETAFIRWWNYYN